MPDFDEIVEQRLAEPAEASKDGQSTKNDPIKDILDAQDRIEARETLSGTNANGGSKSMWGRLRAARAISGGTPPQ